jgi:tRNA pseudouridine38-40 synthase
MEEKSTTPCRIRLDLAYDGRPFSGWQSQVSDDAVQDVVRRALASICPAVTGAQGSGRTDAGVSALGQVAHFDTPADWRMDGGAWQRALNTKLPPAIRVMRCGAIDPRFHARFSALAKTYRYEIAAGEVLPPLRHGLAWHQRDPGPIGDLAAVLSLYEGTHDFGAFSAKRHDGKDEGRDTVRTITTARVTAPDGESLHLEFRGNGFLYKMVRFLVGSAVYCAKGRISREEMKRLLEGSAGEARAPYCAPADGLTLVEVHYPEEFEIFGTDAP